MSEFDPTDVSARAARAALDRRGFLLRLGMLAGAGALVPLAARVQRVVRAPGLERVEAGRPALGTWMRVVARHADRARAGKAIEDAFAAVRKVDEQMSVHRADSQLTRVNRAAGERAITVDPALRDVVAMACANGGRSGGAYDITVLPLMTAYGFYGHDRDRAPSAREIDAALAVMGSGGVRLDGFAGTLALARRGAGIDLGSIGKGWAIDRAVDALRANGVRSGLVDLGGNVYALGTPDDDAKGWTVGVFHPVKGSLERVFVLRDAAVATSANTEQTRRLGPVTVGHLFDARRGTPANGQLSASVMAKTGVESDMLSTTAFVLGPDRFRGWPGALDTHFVG